MLNKYFLNYIHLNQFLSFLLGLSILMVLLPTQVSASVAGKTILAKGEVNATKSIESRKLKRRSKIFDVDNIVTGAKSKAQFSMLDGGLITLKENTEIKISEYQFDQNEQQGSATLEVVSGGLRSISGLIKKSGGDYQVKTPVGSIGIRGTHFAVQVDGEKVHFAVFSGDIDVQLNNNQVLSLGASEDYAFASVSPSGEVRLLTQAPTEISNNVLQGKELDKTDVENETSSSSPSSTSSSPVSSSTSSAVDNDISTESPESNFSGYVNVTSDEDSYADVYNESELQGMDSTPIAELISQRTGTVDYQNFSTGAVSSSVGSVSDFNIAMTIDFDHASVPEGAINYTDEQGKWFAAFSGLINVDQLDLGINFASHGNKKADGEIEAAFSDGLEEVIGSFYLNEVDNAAVTSGGSFKVIAE